MCFGGGAPAGSAELLVAGRVMKAFLPPVSPLRNIVWLAGGHDSCHGRHDQMVGAIPVPVKRRIRFSVPRLTPGRRGVSRRRRG